MQIRDLDPEAPEDREFCAQLLVEEFRDIAPDAWPILDKARETVDECLRNGPVRVAHVNGTIVGWIGGHHVFSRVWELHPLVVARMAQKQGVGRALVADLERIDRGGGRLRARHAAVDARVEVSGVELRDVDRVAYEARSRAGAARRGVSGSCPSSNTCPSSRWS